MPGVLNHPSGGWAFQSLADQLSASLWLDIVTEPTEYNYVLWPGDGVVVPAERSFISPEGVACAADKRLQVGAFAHAGVQTPETHLCQTPQEVDERVNSKIGQRWILKFPTACGALGHRFVSSSSDIPSNWPLPYIVQEFVALERPEVFRIYGIAGELFGFNARRFPNGASCSPWVAHARGARYEHGERAPSTALDQAAKALKATGLFTSFGAVDLMRDSSGRWVVLEVGTDGVVNHVDRDVDDAGLLEEMSRRLAVAFWKQVGIAPWGKGEWQRRR